MPEDPCHTGWLPCSCVSVVPLRCLQLKSLCRRAAARLSTSRRSSPTNNTVFRWSWSAFIPASRLPGGRARDSRSSGRTDVPTRSSSCCARCARAGRLSRPSGRGRRAGRRRRADARRLDSPSISSPSTICARWRASRSSAGHRYRGASHRASALHHRTAPAALRVPRAAGPRADMAARGTSATRCHRAGRRQTLTARPARRCRPGPMSRMRCCACHSATCAPIELPAVCRRTPEPAPAKSRWRPAPPAYSSTSPRPGDLSPRQRCGQIC